MKTAIKHLVRGGLFLAAAAFVAHIQADITVLGLSPTNAALAVAVLAAVDSWLRAEADDS
ncbi:MAG: hypothetical protein OXM88_02655 [bacterium]|nr:hypothetical protein [bacterium]